MKLRSWIGGLLLATAAATAWKSPAVADTERKATPVYTVSPIGWIRKAGGKTFIEIDKRYQPALMGVENLKSLQVLWWFDRNDSPDKRAILQVHPRGDIAPAHRGGFALSSHQTGLAQLWHPGIPDKLQTIVKLQNAYALAEWHGPGRGGGVLIATALGLGRWHPEAPPTLLPWPQPMALDNHWVLIDES